MKNNGDNLEHQLDSIRDELKKRYSPPVLNYAISTVEAILEHFARQEAMSADSREEILYCIHRLLSWTADYQEKDSK